MHVVTKHVCMEWIGIIMNDKENKRGKRSLLAPNSRCPLVALRIPNQFYVLMVRFVADSNILDVIASRPFFHRLYYVLRFSLSHIKFYNKKILQ